MGPGASFLMYHKFVNSGGIDIILTDSEKYNVGLPESVINLGNMDSSLK